MGSVKTNIMTTSGSKTRKVLNIVNTFNEDGGILTHVEVMITRSNGRDVHNPVPQLFTNLNAAQKEYENLT